MNERLLPNGTVILLKEGKLKLMIYGRKQILVTEDEENGKMFDYLAVPYPEGYISAEYTYVFNHESIDKIIFEGYANEEETAFQEVLRNA